MLALVCNGAKRVRETHALASDYPSGILTLVGLAVTLLACGGSIAASADGGVADSTTDTAPLDATGADVMDAQDAPGPCTQVATQCGPPGMCQDCTGASAGHGCIGGNPWGHCGCNTHNDCPPGTACDPAKHLCGASCAGGLACSNGGCCDGVSCVSGTDDGACGLDGGACARCGDTTPVCSSGVCAPCGPDAGACASGTCCNGAGACVDYSNTTCGSPGGACVDCTADPATPVCLPSGKCGCNTEADCPIGSACNQGLCSVKCSSTSPCHGGCCSGTKCAAGDDYAECPTGQTLCAGCPASFPACVAVNGSHVCGCLKDRDCQFGINSGDACDPQTHQCTSSCGANAPCDFSCCTATVNGTCNTNNITDSSCGSYGLCADCSTSSLGRVCKGGNGCGCNSSSDCPGGAPCVSNGFYTLCATPCDAQHPCSSGCCSAPTNGTCQMGFDNAACAAGGAVCQDCTTDPTTPTCVVLVGSNLCGCTEAFQCPAGQACDLGTHACTTACGPNQACNGGCCSNGTCVAGMSATACGGRGEACEDCTKGTRGRLCLLNNGIGCGCSGGPSDCPQPLICNLQTGSCQ
jgi:hypothetical protein